MRAEVGPLAQGRILDLHADQAHPERKYPRCIVLSFELLAIGLRTPQNPPTRSSSHAEANQVENKKGSAHVDHVAVENKLAVVGPSGGSLNEGEANVCYDDPDA